MRVLIAPATTGIGLEIKRSLHLAKNVDLIGCGFETGTEIARQFSEFIYFEAHGNPKDLSDRLMNLMIENSIDLAFIAHDQWLRDLTKIKLPHELHSKIVNLPTQQSAALLSKSITYKTIQISSLVPKIFIDPKLIQDFPVFAKPDFGQGSRGTKKLIDKSELQQFIKSDEFLKKDQYIFAEYLPGPEFTVDCFSDNNSELIFCQSRIRVRITNGIASKTMRVPLPEVQEWAYLISKQYSLIGAWFFQLKLSLDGSMKLLEIGLRVAGASGINRILGVNLSLMQLYQFLGNSITVLEQNFPTVFEQSKNRANILHKVENAYFDYDDTIKGQNGTNQALRNSIISLHKSRVPVTILTRNIHDLNPWLETSGLSQSIHQVVSLKTYEKKSDYIMKNSLFLFVDDSHRERCDVYTKHSDKGLVLDPSAFETELFFESSRIQFDLKWS
jgi:hypothetical protein